VLLMTGAALGDRYGRRRVFVAGLVLFSAASAACALSTGTGALIAARTVQGAGAAMIMPVALGLLNGAFPPARRGWATGVYGSVTAAAAMLGPVLGGAITQGIAWQWVFWLNVPIGLLAVPLVLRRIGESRGPATALDLPGLALAAGAALGVVWALIRANQAGWGSAETVSTLAGGAVLLLAFLAWESRTGTPMLPLRLFRSPAFSAGNASIFFMNATLSGAIFFTAQFHQVALGEGPLGAGLRLLPWGIAPFLVAPRAGALADRIGERVPVVAGTVLLAAGMGWLALASGPGAGYLGMVAPMTIGGIGFALAVPAATKAVVSRVAPPDIGRASGTYSTVRQLGGAFGVAILGAVFATGGGYGSARDFSAGFVPALGVAAALAFAAAVAGLALPGRPSSRRPSPPAVTEATPVAVVSSAGAAHPSRG
jgi:EmrB/QacA subfamily drug resistance transporter